ncbi:PQQ-like domain-containing protein [Nocardioides scoriae]|uniref:PQQ-like domain-containing protein n=1 Tax=Nocardioides scoriae TaxID=642780 RepID=A0A1H1UPC5_9ACTN|nr:PQQ-like domain-containing protein [Nocardioides scoriae]
MVALVLAVLGAGVGTWLTRREPTPACGAEVTSYAAVDARSPFLDAAQRRADPDPRRDRLVRTLARDAAPVGEVLGAVGYDYEQLVRVDGFEQGLGVRLRDSPDLTLLDDTTLAPRWRVAVGTQRSAYDADAERYVVVTRPEDRAPEVVVLDADTGRREWCARLDGGALPEAASVSTQLLDDGLVVRAGGRLARLGADGPGWEQQASGDADTLTSWGPDRLLLGGAAVDDLLDPAALASRPAGEALRLLDARTGEARWTRSEPRGSGLHVVGVDEAADRAVVARWTARRGGRTEVRLAALDDRGRQTWSVLPAGGAAFDATVRAGRVLVRAGERWSAYATDDGRRLWGFRVPRSPQFLPYGADLAAVPLLDADHVLVAGTRALHVVDLRDGTRRSLPLPTDGVSTTYWPYQVALTPSLLAVATSTGAVVVRRG